MSAMADPVVLLVVSVVGVVLFLIALYFVIKSAIRDALSADRESLATVERLRDFQAKVDAAKQQNSA